MKKHRLDNGDYPYENGHLSGKYQVQESRDQCFIVRGMLGLQDRVNKTYFKDNTSGNWDSSQFHILF